MTYYNVTVVKELVAAGCELFHTKTIEKRMVQQMVQLRQQCQQTTLAAAVVQNPSPNEPPNRQNGTVRCRNNNTNHQHRSNRNRIRKVDRGDNDDSDFAFVRTDKRIYCIHKHKLN